MGKFKDLVEQKGYKIDVTPVKTIRVPTAEEYAQAKERARTATVATTGIKAAALGGIQGAETMLTALDVKPKVGENMATRGLGTAPTLGGPAPLTGGTDQQVAERKTANAGRELEELQARLAEAEQRAAVLNESSDPEDWAQLPAAQAEVNALLEEVNAKRNEYQELDSQAVTMRNNTMISQLTDEEYRALENYAYSRRGGIDEVPAWLMRTQPEVAALIEKYGRDAVDSMAETVERVENRRAAETQMATAQAAGEQLGFGAIPFTVVSGIVGAPQNAAGIVRDLFQGNGGYASADPYHAGSMLSHTTNAMNQGAMKKAPEQLVNLGQGFMQMQSKGATNFNPTLYEDVKESPMGEVVDVVGSGAYQVVSTAADTVARAYLGGGLFGAGTTAAKVTSLGLAGVRSFGDTYNDVSAKGGTPGQALVLGILNGGTEIATEYIPLDEWWKIAEGGAKPVAEMMKQAALQGAIELSQEEIGFFATTMAEYAILREKSEFQVLKKDLINSGIDPEKAEEMIWGEFLRQAAGVAATSFFSGSLSTAGAQAFQALMPGAVIQQTTQEQGAQPNAQPAAQAEKPFIAAENAPQTQQTQNQAQEQAVPATQTAQTQAEQATVPATETVPQTQTPLRAAQEYYRQNGAVTNSMANAILADSEAVKFLEDNAELKLGGTRSQDRNAVKAAVARTVETAQMTAEGAVETITGAMADLEEQRAETVTTDNKPAPETAQSPVQTTQEAQTEQATTEDRGGVTELDEAIGPVVGRSMEQSQEQAQTQEQVQTANAPEGMEHGAVGAAEAGFHGREDYYRLLDRGEQRDRETDVRPMQMPTHDQQGREISESAGNAYGAAITSDDMARALEDMAMIGALSHDTKTNQEAVDAAAASIKKSGWAKTTRDVVGRAMNGRIQDGDIEKAILAYAHYNKVNDIDSASDLMIALSAMATQSGRNLQLFSLFRRLTPEGKLMTVQKTIRSTIEGMNAKRGKNNQQADIELTPEMEQMYLEAARIAGDEHLAVSDGIASELMGNLWEDARGAAETALASYQPRGSRGPDANVTTNDLVDRIGQRVADNLQRTAQEQNRSAEDVLYAEIMRFVNDKVDAGTGRPRNARQQNANLETLADYYRYQPFFQNAWDNARARVEAALATMPDDDPRVDVIYSFLNDFTGSGIESPVMRPGDYSNARSTVRKATGEAARMAGVRMDNRSQRRVDANGDSTALAFGQMRDVLTMNTASKEAAAMRIAEIAVGSMGLDGVAAQQMAIDVVNAFYADLSERSAARVEQLLRPKDKNKPVRKSIAQRLGELYNAGAFTQESTRQAVMDTVFGKDSGIDVPDTLMERYVNAANDALWDAEEAVYKWAGAQMRGTRADKWRAWRYMCMLGSYRTQLRNVIGNSIMMPYKTAKDVIATGFERVFIRDQSKRTKAILTLSKNDRALRAWAREDAESRPVSRAMEYSASIGDDVSRSILMREARVFENDTLEELRRGIMEIPGAMDMFFKNRHYYDSLAGFLKARGYTAEQVTSGQVSEEVLNEGRVYAIGEAMRATFNDCNQISDLIVALRTRGNTTAERVLNAMAEGKLPFRRTPANILVRAWEYSPMGMITASATAVNQLRNGEFSAATFIDRMSASAVGTGAMALGWLFASGALGFRLRGRVSEDEKRKGAKDNSIEVAWGGETKYYTIGWAAPVVIPLFVGANIYEMTHSPDEEMQDASMITRAIYGCATALEPMLELSCLSALNDMAYTFRTADKNELGYALVVDAVTDWLFQGIPSLLRQAENAVYKNERTTYANSADPLLRGLQKEVSNIPFVGQIFKTDKLTEWGEEVSKGGVFKRVFDAFFNPGKSSTLDTSALEAEIERLNGVQPNSVSPNMPEKTLTYTNEETGEVHRNYRLTKEEWSELVRINGQTARELLEELTASEEYAALTDAQKAELFDKVYAYAIEAARSQVFEGYEPDYTKWEEAFADGDTGSIFRSIASGDASGGFTDWLDGAEDKGMAQINSAISAYDALTDAEKAQMREEAGGRVENMLLAYDAGMEPEQFLELYEKYDRIDKTTGLNATQRTNEWSTFLSYERDAGRITKEQEQILRDNMLYWTRIPGSSQKFDLMGESGMSTEDRKAVLDTIDLLQPLAGEDEVSAFQRYEAIAGMDLTEAEIDAAMLAYMPDYNPDAKSPNRTEVKYQDIRDMGFTPEEYIMIYQVYRDEEAVGGKGTKNRTKAAIDAIPGITTKEAEMLYDILSGDKYKKKK